MGCSEKKREQLTSGIYHLHQSKKCYLVNVVFQYRHMSDRTLEPAESKPRASRASREVVGDRPSFTKTLPILVGSKTVKLLRPTTTIFIEEGYAIKLRFFVVILTFLFSPNLCRSMLFRT